MRLLSHSSLTFSASNISLLFSKKEKDTESRKRLTLQEEKSLSYSFYNFQKFLNNRSVNRENDLAIHGKVCFIRKHDCVSLSEGSTLKDCHVNKCVVIDAVESDNSPFEVILK